MKSATLPSKTKPFAPPARSLLMEHQSQFKPILIVDVRIQLLNEQKRFFPDWTYFACERCRDESKGQCLRAGILGDIKMNGLKESTLNSDSGIQERGTMFPSDGNEVSCCQELFDLIVSQRVANMENYFGFSFLMIFASEKGVAERAWTHDLKCLSRKYLLWLLGKFKNNLINLGMDSRAGQFTKEKLKTLEIYCKLKKIRPDHLRPVSNFPPTRVYNNLKKRYGNGSKGTGGFVKKPRKKGNLQELKNQEKGDIERTIGRAWGKSKEPSRGYTDTIKKSQINNYDKKPGLLNEENIENKSGSNEFNDTFNKKPLQPESGNFYTKEIKVLDFDDSEKNNLQQSSKKQEISDQNKEKTIAEILSRGRSNKKKKKTPIKKTKFELDSQIYPESNRFEMEISRKQEADQDIFVEDHKIEDFQEIKNFKIFSAKKEKENSLLNDHLKKRPLIENDEKLNDSNQPFNRDILLPKRTNLSFLNNLNKNEKARAYKRVSDAVENLIGDLKNLKSKIRDLKGKFPSISLYLYSCHKDFEIYQKNHPIY